MYDNITSQEIKLQKVRMKPKIRSRSKVGNLDNFVRQPTKQKTNDTTKRISSTLSSKLSIRPSQFSRPKMYKKVGDRPIVNFESNTNTSTPFRASTANSSHI